MVLLPTVSRGNRVVLLPTVITGYQGGIITYSYCRVSTWYYYLLQLLKGIRVVLLPTIVITGYRGGIISF